LNTVSIDLAQLPSKGQARAVLVCKSSIVSFLEEFNRLDPIYLQKKRERKKKESADLGKSVTCF
jgi:hypothetical protein